MKHVVAAILGLTGCIFYSGHARAEWKTVNCSDIDIEMTMPSGGSTECTLAEDDGTEFQNVYYHNDDSGLSIDVYYAKAGHKTVFTDSSLEEDIKESSLAKTYDITFTERGSANGYSYLGFTASAANRATLQCVRFSRSAMRDSQDGRARRLGYGFVCAQQAVPLKREVVDSILDGIKMPN